jgi:hypothetical protein
MRRLKKAYLIGQQTAGAETPIEFIPIEGEYILQLPCYQRIFSIEGPGWQGRGVSPDLNIEVGKAFHYAYKKFIKYMFKKRNNNPEINYNWILEDLESAFVDLDKDQEREYIGNYGTRKIFFQENNLCYQDGNGPVWVLIQMNNLLFKFKKTEAARIRFSTFKNQTVSRFRIEYEDGSKTKWFGKTE